MEMVEFSKFSITASAVGMSCNDVIFLVYPDF